MLSQPGKIRFWLLAYYHRISYTPQQRRMVLRDLTAPIESKSSPCKCASVAVVPCRAPYHPKASGIANLLRQEAGESTLSARSFPKISFRQFLAGYLCPVCEEMFLYRHIEITLPSISHKLHRTKVVRLDYRASFPIAHRCPRRHGTKLLLKTQFI